MPREEFYEPVSLAPAAAGWRAIYSRSEGGLRVAPIVAWGVFHKTIRRVPRGEIVKDLGNVLEGVVADAQFPSVGAQLPGRIRGFSCAAKTSSFEGYLDPDTPDPTH
jgi:hypothetical protein